MPIPIPAPIPVPTPAPTYHPKKAVSVVGYENDSVGFGSVQGLLREISSRSNNGNRGSCVNKTPPLCHTVAGGKLSDELKEEVRRNKEGLIQLVKMGEHRWCQVDECTMSTKGVPIS